MVRSARYVAAGRCVRSTATSSNPCVGGDQPAARGQGEDIVNRFLLVQCHVAVGYITRERRDVRRPADGAASGVVKRQSQLDLMLWNTNPGLRLSGIEHRLHVGRAGLQIFGTRIPCGAVAGNWCCLQWRQIGVGLDPDDETGVERDGLPGVDPVTAACVQKLQARLLRSARKIRMVSSVGRIPRGHSLDLGEFFPGKKRSDVDLRLVQNGHVKRKPDKVPADIQASRDTNGQILSLEPKGRRWGNAFDQEKIGLAENRLIQWRASPPVKLVLVEIRKRDVGWQCFGIDVQRAFQCAPIDVLDLPSSDTLNAVQCKRRLQTAAPGIAGIEQFRAAAVRSFHAGEDVAGVPIGGKYLEGDEVPTGIEDQLLPFHRM